VTITAARSPFRHEPGLDFAAPEEDERFEEALARVRSQLGRTYPLVIGGTEVDRGETFASLNPARPAEVIGHHAAATLDDVDAAIAAAGEAFADWSQTHAEERAALLFDVADRIVERRRDFAALLTLEVGKIREEADGEIAEVADVLRWYAQQMLDLDRPRPLLPVDGEQTSLVYVPLGVGAIVSPWNFPLSLTTGMMSAALVAGNTVVVKPASASATSAAWLVDLFRECGAPAGVINLLTGSGGLIGDALVDHPQTRFVAFTGSKDVGVRINERAARLQAGQIWIKRVQLELGGKNAILVDETDNAFADVYSAAVSVQNLSVRRRQATTIVGSTLIGIAAAWYLVGSGQGIGGPYETFLLLIGGLFVPLLGVVIAETFVVRRSRYSPSDFFQAAPRWRWPAFASWFPGTALYFVIVWFGLPIGATLPSFALAAGLHVVFSKVEQGFARSSPLVSGGDP